MFGVFGFTLHGEEFSGRGDTPQMAWDTMLRDFHVNESDIDMDSVVFYREIEVTRETKSFWAEE